MTASTGTVYVLVDPRGDVIAYVGQTTRSLQQRLAGHMSSAGQPASPWIAELKSLGLRPAIRAIVEDVPSDDLNRVEREQIEAHYQAGWPLWNLYYAGGTWPARRLIHARYAHAQAVGGVLLERAQRDLRKHEESVARYKEMRKEDARRDHRLYPHDPDRYRRAMRCHLAGYREGLTPQQFDLAVDMLLGMVAAAAPHGVTLRQVMSRFGTARAVVDLIDVGFLTYPAAERERLRQERHRAHFARINSQAA